MNITTFKDFSFRATHSLPRSSGAASQRHWHNYVVRLWFADAPDQDLLSELLSKRFHFLHGAYLNSIILPESTDEALARWFLEDLSFVNCFRVTVTNDDQRGAEVTK